MAFDPIEKYINEHGSAANRAEITALQREQFADKDSKLATITVKRDALLVEVKSLREQVASLSIAQQFKSYNGVLWPKGENVPYCPKCQTVMHPFPPPAVDEPMVWTCTPCQVKIPYLAPTDTATAPNGSA